MSIFSTYYRKDNLDLYSILLSFSVEKQIEKAGDKKPPVEKKEAKPLVRADEDELIKLDIKLGPTKPKEEPKEEPPETKTSEVIEETDEKHDDEVLVKPVELENNKPSTSVKKSSPPPAKSPEPESKSAILSKRTLKREVSLAFKKKILPKSTP